VTGGFLEINLILIIVIGDRRNGEKVDGDGKKKKVYGFLGTWVLIFL
jgi:hypothetical protein